MEARRTNAPDITDMVDDERLSLDSRHYRPFRARIGSDNQSSQTLRRHAGSATEIARQRGVRALDKWSS